MTVKELAKQIHKDNIERGWWDPADLPLTIAGTRDRFIAVEKLALIHSEISEALEEMRSSKRDFSEVYTEGNSKKPLGFPTELADAVIRILDLAEACHIDIEKVIDEKLAYNRTRGHRYGGKLL